MNIQIERAWNVLTYPFAYIPGAPQPFVRWFAKDAEGFNLGGMCKTPEELENTITPLNKRGFNIYAHLNPTFPRIAKRAKIGDTLAWAFTLVDLDPLTGMLEPEEAAQHALRVAKSTWEFIDPDWTPKPVVVYTGRGLHLWFRLHPTVGGDWAAIANAQREWLKHVRIPDTLRLDRLCDTARVVRMPGTVNHRTGRVSEMLSMGANEPAGAVAKIVSLAKAPEHVTPQGGTDLDWKDVKNELTTRARTFLDWGAEEGTRHETCWHVATMLKAHGVSRASAVDALEHGNEVSPKRLTTREIADVVNQVYGR